MLSSPPPPAYYLSYAESSWSDPMSARVIAAELDFGCVPRGFDVTC
jgi:hypothetical protein